MPMRLMTPTRVACCALVGVYLFVRGDHVHDNEVEITARAMVDRCG